MLNEPRLYLDLDLIKADDNNPMPKAPDAGGDAPKQPKQANPTAGWITYRGNRENPAELGYQQVDGKWKKPKGQGRKKLAKEETQAPTEGQNLNEEGKAPAEEPQQAEGQQETSSKEQAQAQLASQQPAKTLVSSGDKPQAEVSSPAAKIEAAKQGDKPVDLLALQKEAGKTREKMGSKTGGTTGGGIEGGTSAADYGAGVAAEKKKDEDARAAAIAKFKKEKGVTKVPSQQEQAKLKDALDENLETGNTKIETEEEQIARQEAQAALEKETAGKADPADVEDTSAPEGSAADKELDAMMKDPASARKKEKKATKKAAAKKAPTKKAPTKKAPTKKAATKKAATKKTKKVDIDSPEMQERIKRAAEGSVKTSVPKKTGKKASRKTKAQKLAESKPHRDTTYAEEAMARKDYVGAAHALSNHSDTKDPHYRRVADEFSRRMKTTPSSHLQRTAKGSASAQKKAKKAAADFETHRSGATAKKTTKKAATKKTATKKKAGTNLVVREANKVEEAAKDPKTREAAKRISEAISGGVSEKTKKEATRKASKRKPAGPSEAAVVTPAPGSDKKVTAPKANATSNMKRDYHNAQVRQLRDNLRSHLRTNKKLKGPERQRIQDIHDALEAHGELRNAPEKEHGELLRVAKQAAGAHGKARHTVQTPKPAKKATKAAKAPSKKKQLERMKGASTTGKKATKAATDRAISQDPNRLRSKGEPPPLPSEKRQKQMRAEVDRNKKKEANAKARQEAKDQKAWETKREEARLRDNTPDSAEGMISHHTFKNESKTLADNIRHHMDNTEMDDSRKEQLRHALTVLDHHDKLEGVPTKDMKAALAGAKKLAGQHGKAPKPAKEAKAPKEKAKKPVPYRRMLGGAYRAGKAAGASAATPESAGAAATGIPETGGQAAGGTGHHLLHNRKVAQENKKAKAEAAKKAPKKGGEVEQSSMSKSLYIDLSKGASIPNAGVTTPSPEKSKQHIEDSYKKRPGGVASADVIEHDETDEKDKKKDEQVEKSFTVKATDFLKSLNNDVRTEIRLHTPSSLEAEFMVDVLGYDVSKVRKGLCSIVGSDRHRFNEWAADRLSKSIENLNKRLS